MKRFLNTHELPGGKILPLRSQPRLMADLCSVLARPVFDGNTLRAGECAYELVRDRFNRAFGQIENEQVKRAWLALFPEDEK